MAKQSAFPPFMDMDLTKFDLSKFIGEMKMPGIDMEAMVSAQKKNIDAFTKANQLAYEGVQAILKRQAEIVRQAMEDAPVMASHLTDAEATPTDRMVKQTELTKDLFERTLSNIKELSEMVSKSNTEVMDLLNTRISQSLLELKDLIEKTPAMPFAPMEGAAPGKVPAKATRTAPKTAVPANAS